MKKRKKIGSFLPRKINYPWVSSLKSITERKNPQSGAPVFCDAPLGLYAGRLERTRDKLSPGLFFPFGFTLSRSPDQSQQAALINRNSKLDEKLIRTACYVILQWFWIVLL